MTLLHSRRSQFVAALIVMCARTTAAQTIDPRIADLDAYVTRATREWNAPGLAIAVVKDGKIVFEKGYGVREIGKSGVIDTATIFPIASTTKAMTAAALAMLVDEGKVKWDDPVTKYIPSLQLYDPYVTRELTVRDLLTHRAGVGNSDFLWYLTDLPHAEIIKRLRLVKPDYSLRSSFAYQNVMYSLAGDVIAAASGVPWEQFVSTRIFQPIGMTRTFPTFREAKAQSNMASPHWRSGDTLTVIDQAPIDAISAAGGVWSDIADMAKWTRFLLDSGKIGSTRYIKPSTFAELFAPQASVPPDEFYPSARLTHAHWMTYGFGWFQQDYRGRMVNFHTGSIDGSVAIIGLIPEERLGVYVLANADHVEVRHALMLRVFDLFLGEPIRDWSAELQKVYAARTAGRDSSRRAEEAKRVRGTKPSLALEKYVGVYSDSLAGKLELTWVGGRLRARTSSMLAGNVEHWQYDTFRIRWDRVAAGSDFMTFTIGEGGVPALVQFAGFTFRRDGPR